MKMNFYSIIALPLVSIFTMVPGKVRQIDKGTTDHQNTVIPKKSDDTIGVIELRNYVMKHGMREKFIPLFENNFVESQDTLHAHILGRYIVSGREDNFCWIRGFKDMATRSVFLPTFYKGPVWRAHRNEANGMLANNDNVYLLKPMVTSGDSLVTQQVNADVLRPQKGITVVDLYVANHKLPHLLKLYTSAYREQMGAAGFSRLSLWTSELRENDFPQLPVFQDPNLLVVISFFASEAEYHAAMSKLNASLSKDQKADFDDTVTIHNTWVLHPTARSLK